MSWLDDTKREAAAREQAPRKATLAANQLAAEHRRREEEFAGTTGPMIERNLRDVAQATWGDAFKLDQRTVTKAAARAGVEGNVSPHWLRHTRATHALEWGALVLLVQAAVGHAAVATAGRYLHARPIDSSWTYLAF